MANKNRQTVFRLKRFDIHNEQSAMKVGTDGILIGAWCCRDCDCRAIADVLDVGAGTGIIALMAAQRFPEARVVGVEIDSVAAAEASANVAASSFAERVEIVEADFNEFQTADRFDLIVSNPPFFTEATVSTDRSRSVARSEGSLKISALLAKAATLLRPDGRIAIVAPTSRDEQILFDATMARLAVSEQCRVITVAGKSPTRTLWQFSLKNQPCKSTTLTICSEPGVYTNEYIDLVKDFYLGM